MTWLGVAVLLPGAMPLLRSQFEVVLSSARVAKVAVAVVYSSKEYM